MQLITVNSRLIMYSIHKVCTTVHMCVDMMCLMFFVTTADAALYERVADTGSIHKGAIGHTPDRHF
jgi:hypothetical protein